jgi:hypothetical protein
MWVRAHTDLRSLPGIRKSVELTKKSVLERKFWELTLRSVYKVKLTLKSV